MGLSASMWSSVSGLLAHGEKMNVIGNNIANVSTLGFKSQRMDFQDFFYQDGFSAGGPTQIGRGVSINALLGDFSQGSFESTNDPTDLAIGGKGYFQVKDPYSDQVWYSRAGNFRFDNEGALRNPQGYAVQGWKIDNSSNPAIATGANPTVNAISKIQGTGTPTDIVLDTWTVPPKQTTKVSLSMNLTADSGYDKTSNVNNPFFALSSRWNGAQPATPAGTPPLSADAYAYQTSLKVYDEGGTSHTLTTYFDQVTSDLSLGKTTKNTLDSPAGSIPLLTNLFGKDGKTVPLAQVQTEMTTLLGLPLSDIPLEVLPSGAFRIDLAKSTLTDAQKTAINTFYPNYTSFGTPSAALAADKVGISDMPTGYKMYEYVVTMPPSEDQRTWGGTYDPVTGLLTGETSFQQSKKAGVLMTGTIIFNAAGEIVNQTAYTYGGNMAPGENETLKLDPDDDSTWQPTAVSNNGLPVFSANFSGHPMANSVRQSSSNDKPGAASYLMEFDLGFKCVGNLKDPWGIGDPVIPPATSVSAADAIGLGKTSYLNIYDMADGKKQSGSTTNRGGSSVTQSSIQDGYASGNLTNTSVDQDGVLYGVYSNGVTLPLYQLTLYDFLDPQGLRREGGNLFSSTRKSGTPQISAANQGGMGNINAYNIEQSNVDMSREFVQMIVTQRGFQANSKGITTVDTMLEQVINMKR